MQECFTSKVTAVE